MNANIRRVVKRAWIPLASALLTAVWPFANVAAQSLELNQYAHTSWKLRSLIPNDFIDSFAQTRDGYLWLATLDGLYRFDGVRAVRWKPPAGEQLPGNEIHRLRVSRDGTLWIGTDEGLASWRDGKLTIHREVAGKKVYPIFEDSSGVVWFGLQQPGQLCAIRPNGTSCHGTGEFGSGVDDIFADRNGNLWVLSGTGLWRWAPGTPQRYSIDAEPYRAYAAEDDSGAIVVASQWGLKRLERGTLKPYPLPGITGQFTAAKLFRSSDGSLWISSPYAGLFHLHHGRTDHFTAADGLSSDLVDSFFEDREHNVWVSTENGLDQFHPLAAARVASKQGLSAHTVWSVQATADGSVWMATPAGLNRWRNGRVTVYADETVAERPAPNAGAMTARLREVPNRGVQSPVYSLGLDNGGRLWASTIHGLVHYTNGRFMSVRGSPSGYASAIAGDSRGAVWFTYEGVGLFQWSPDGVVRRTQAAQKDGTNSISMLLPDSKGGAMWASLFKVGVAHIVDGQIQSTYTTADGLGGPFVHDIRESADHALWAATQGGLSRVKDGHITTLSARNGLPCDFVQWSIEDDDHALWMYTSCGLVRVAGSEVDAWVRDPTRRVKLTTYARRDNSYVCCPYRPAVTKASDGRIWFADGDGASVIDPRRVPFNEVAPPVYIERIIADGKSFDVAAAGRERVRLPSRVRNLEIQYTALSLTAPDKVPFRFMLESQDPRWREVINKRQVEYSNLPPGSYRFRVTAANNDGVWNTAGAALELTVPPAFYQALWFRVLCVAALMALFVALHRARVRQVERRAEERQRSDEALGTLRAELAHATRMSSLATLTASIAHEVNQPLTGIITNASTCQRMLSAEPPNVDGAREAVRRLARDGNRAADVITRLRALFAKKGAAAEPVDLNDATREVIALSESELARARAALGVELAEDLPLVIGDRVQLQQVIINLLRNACDALHAVDGRPREIVITTAQEADNGDERRVCLRVRDSGVGLGPNEAEKLFGAFYSTKQNGMGIGLSVCRSIIENHHGRLWVAPNDGPGVTFAFSIPCVPVERVATR